MRLAGRRGARGHGLGMPCGLGPRRGPCGRPGAGLGRVQAQRRQQPARDLVEALDERPVSAPALQAQHPVVGHDRQPPGHEHARLRSDVVVAEGRAALDDQHPVAAAEAQQPGVSTRRPKRLGPVEGLDRGQHDDDRHRLQQGRQRPPCGLQRARHYDASGNIEVRQLAGPLGQPPGGVGGALRVRRREQRPQRPLRGVEAVAVVGQQPQGDRLAGHDQRGQAPRRGRVVGPVGLPEALRQPGARRAGLDEQRPLAGLAPAPGQRQPDRPGVELRTAGGDQR